MFGLTKREQRWKAEQKAAETIAGVLFAAINAKSHKGEEMNKSEQLIACLEGEIAKRDARIVELERYDEAVERAAFEAWHKDRYPAVKIMVQNLLGTYTNTQVECNFETWLACAESHSKRFGGALLDASARLNGPPVHEAKAQGVVIPRLGKFKTSDGGRSYVAEFFKTALQRHDFTTYINERLAADFACALADGLYQLAAAPAAPAADSYSWSRKDGVNGIKQFMTQKCYAAQTDAIKQYYEPFKCANCKAADAGLVEALELAANRLDRLALEQGEFWRGYATAWADEARAAHRAKGVV